MTSEIPLSLINQCVTRRTPKVPKSHLFGSYILYHNWRNNAIGGFLHKNKNRGRRLAPPVFPYPRPYSCQLTPACRQAGLADLSLPINRLTDQLINSSSLLHFATQPTTGLLRRLKSRFRPLFPRALQERTISE